MPLAQPRPFQCTRQTVEACAWKREEVRECGERREYSLNLSCSLTHSPHSDPPFLSNQMERSSLCLHSIRSDVIVVDHGHSACKTHESTLLTILKNKWSDKKITHESWGRIDAAWSEGRRRAEEGQLCREWRLERSLWGLTLGRLCNTRILFRQLENRRLRNYPRATG